MNKTEKKIYIYMYASLNVISTAHQFAPRVTKSNHKQSFPIHLGITNYTINRINLREIISY